MAAKSTLRVPHLRGIDVGYRLSGKRIDPEKPTVVLLNSMCVTSSLYEAQFASGLLTGLVNLLAIEPLGHGATTTSAEHWTYWDSAHMALETMEALGVEKAFVLGTSQGGWIAVRMALLAPDKILGLLPLGTSMDSESEASREMGGWDPEPLLTPFYEKWSVSTPDFVVDEVWCGMVGQLGFSGTASAETLAFWGRTLKEVYSGEEGRKKLRMALLNLMERDGLLRRLRDIKCPVYWLQAANDPVFGKVIPAEHIKLFTSSPEATLTFVEAGGHYLSATSPLETEEAIVKMVNTYA
ncbi:Alpha/Beta hydrolase protein [Stachybotrys elegans]|uniref:Alpha/Beta hydrolase protein n=1 Tax=Stachybotrys elegans TaxID=80388 RepID=A0A8K0SPT9_9HYPO|nr:Alpha/Beta hydrolase protein [Stachybotrys elegans]